MRSIIPEDFKKVYKKENDPDVKVRMLAVHMFYARNKNVEEIAQDLLQCPNWIRFWIKRFEEDGLLGLHDLPHTGRPPKIPYKELDPIMEKVAKEPITPECYSYYCMKSLESDFTLRTLEKSCTDITWAKKPTMVHVNHANKKQVISWQNHLKKNISRLEKDGYIIGFQDETIMIHDPSGGQEVLVSSKPSRDKTYTGDHKRIIVYGFVTEGQGNMFESHDKFNAETFLKYLKNLLRKFGKIVLILDRASQHRAKIVKEFLRKNPNVKLIYIPKGSPI